MRSRSSLAFWMCEAFLCTTPPISRYKTSPTYFQSKKRWNLSNWCWQPWTDCPRKISQVVWIPDSKYALLILELPKNAEQNLVKEFTLLPAGSNNPDIVGFTWVRASYIRQNSRNNFHQFINLPIPCFELWWILAFCLFIFFCRENVLDTELCNIVFTNFRQGETQEQPKNLDTPKKCI